MNLVIVLLMMEVIQFILIFKQPNQPIENFYVVGLDKEITIPFGGSTSDKLFYYKGVNFNSAT